MVERVGKRRGDIAMANGEDRSSFRFLDEPVEPERKQRMVLGLNFTHALQYHPVPVSAGTELIVPLVAAVVLGFGFRTRTMLRTPCRLIF